MYIYECVFSYHVYPDKVVGKCFIFVLYCSKIFILYTYIEQLSVTGERMCTK